MEIVDIVRAVHYHGRLLNDHEPILDTGIPTRDVCALLRLLCINNGVFRYQPTRDVSENRIVRGRSESSPVLAGIII